MPSNFQRALLSIHAVLLFASPPLAVWAYGVRRVESVEIGSVSALAGLLWLALLIGFITHAATYFTRVCETHLYRPTQGDNRVGKDR